MANNYLQFSEIVPALTESERTWAQRVLGCNPEGENGKAAGRLLAEAGIEVEPNDLEVWPDFQWEVEPPEHDLWLYTEECGNVENACEFVRAFLARFRPSACWRLTWATTCSRPRIGEFGGGGAFVTASSVKFYVPDVWLARRKKKFERKTGSRDAAAHS